MEFSQTINIVNKKAYFNYEILDKYIAGIQLTGTEIKSIRLGKVSLVDCFCYFVDGELFVRGMNINEYSLGTYNNHIPRRDRKLLLERRELNKLERKVDEKGLTLVATRLFINDKGLAKLEFAIGKGKKEYDKREDIKKRETQRDMDRIHRK
jgi:SsrA-binding protein